GPAIGAADVDDQVGIGPEAVVPARERDVAGRDAAAEDEPVGVDLAAEVGVVDGVVAVAAIPQVGVVAAEADQSVVAAPALQRIVAEEPQDRVGAGRSSAGEVELVQVFARPHDAVVEHHLLRPDRAPVELGIADEEENVAEVDGVFGAGNAQRDIAVLREEVLHVDGAGDDDVLRRNAGAEFERVGLERALDTVLAVAGPENIGIVAVAAEHVVVPAAADDDIVAGAVGDLVLAVAAAQHVVAVTAVDVVVARAS